VCYRDEWRGEPRRSSKSEGGLALAQFRFDTPQLAAGSFIFLNLLPSFPEVASYLNYTPVGFDPSGNYYPRLCSRHLRNEKLERFCAEGIFINMLRSKIVKRALQQGFSGRSRCLLHNLGL
jgi:hypothetical protein